MPPKIEFHGYAWRFVLGDVIGDGMKDTTTIRQAALYSRGDGHVDLQLLRKFGRRLA